MCVTKKVQYLNRTYSSSIVTTFLVIFNTHTIWTKNVPIYFWLNPFFIFLKNCIYYIIVYWTIYIYMKPCMPLIRYLGSVLAQLSFFVSTLLHSKYRSLLFGMSWGPGLEKNAMQIIILVYVFFSQPQKTSHWTL